MKNLLDSLFVLKSFIWDRPSRAPQSALPEVRPDMEEFLKNSPYLKFIWFGHSTLLFNLEGKLILVDPVFSDYAFSFEVLVKRFQPPVLKLEELPPIDMILISHDHYDHLDKKTVKFFKNSKTSFIVPRGVGTHLLNWGIPKERFTEVSLHQSFEKDNITFTATPAQHFSGRTLFDRNKTLWASWVIKSENEKIFYSGDSGYGKHFKEIGDEYGPFDVAFIENGQYDKRWPIVHMQPEETIEAYCDLNANFLVPVHWGMFDLSLHNWSEPIERTYKIASAWEIPFYAPKLGEVVNTGAPYQNIPWWNLSEEKALPKLQLVTSER